MNKVECVVYKMDSGRWALAVNPKTDCKIFTFETKARAVEKSKEMQEGGN